MIKKRYNIIDLFKFISAVLIIIIHTHPLLNINYEADFVLNNIICRIAVPFFLVCSGFFIGKMSKYDGVIFVPNKEYFKNQFIKIFKLYLIWSLIYLIISVYGWKKNGWFSAFAFLDWIIAFFTKGSYYHLWYLISLLYAIPLVYFIMKKVKKKYYGAIMIVLYAIQVIVYAYRFIIPKSLSNMIKICDYFECPFVAITRVMPFLLLGIIISQKKNDKSPALKCLVSFTLLIIEVCLLRYNNQEKLSYVFFTFPTSYYLFCMVLKIGVNEHIGTHKIFRSSTFLYCVHPVFVWLLSEFFKIDNQWMFILTVILSVVAWKISDIVKYTLKSRKCSISRYIA